MNKYVIDIGSKEYVFGIDRYKIINVVDEELRFAFVKTFEKVFSKGKDSDYCQESENGSRILINDKTIDLKNSVFVPINKYFDIDTDLKMGSKSLVLKYLDFALGRIEYCDEFATVKGSLELLTNFLSEELLDFEESGFKVSFGITDFNKKTLLSLIEGNISIEEYPANKYDLSIADTLLIQLNMLKRMASSDKTKNFVSLIELDDINKKVIEFIKHLKEENLEIIILTKSFYPDLYTRFLVIREHAYDFAIEESVNELIMDLPFHITFEEIKSILQSYVNNDLNDERLYLIKNTFKW